MEAVNPMGTPKKTKALRKTLARDPLYRAAWLACREPWISKGWGEGAPVKIDLRVALNKLLKSGWSIQALETFANSWCDWRRDHLTRKPWRWAVYWADGEQRNALLGTQIAQRYLDTYNAKQRGRGDPIG